MQNTLFTLENVRVRQSISYSHITISANKLTFIIGKSGAGKSTLLQLLNASTDFDCGKITYNNKDIQTIPPLALRQEIILIPQKIYLYPTSILENFVEYYTLLDKACPSPEKISSTLQELGLDKALDTPCNDLSGGEKQRVYLAICLLLEPKVLLLDEPTSALDLENAKRLMHYLRKLVKKQSIVLVCHDQHLFEFADTIIELN